MTVEIKDQVAKWIEDVVIGLGFCPFAAEPFFKNRVKLSVSAAENRLQLLLDLQAEIDFLANVAQDEFETTLLIIPGALADFADFNQFLNQVDDLLVSQNHVGQFQVASFHPNYQFADTEPTDVENFTNRSPYPILHILREDSVSAAIASHPTPDKIPQDNIATLHSLTKEKLVQLFGAKAR